MANDFNIGILSTLDVDSNSSTESINRTIKDIEKKINSVAINIEADNSTKAIENAKSTANQVINTITNDSKLKNIKVELDVNKTQSQENIRRAISDLSKSFADKKIKVKVDASVDTSAAQKAGQSINSSVQKGTENIESPLTRGSFEKDYASMKNSLLDLQRSYANLNQLSNQLARNRDANLRAETKAINDANGALQAYQVTLQHVNAQGKNAERYTANYKANDDGSLNLEKVTKVDSTEKSRKQTHHEILSAIEKENAAIDRMVEKNKITINQANELKRQFNQLSNFKSTGELINPKSFEEVKQKTNAISKEFQSQNDKLRTQEKIHSNIASEIARINKLNASGKINTGQANQLKKQLQSISPEIDQRSLNATLSSIRERTSDYTQQNKLLRQQQSILSQIERSERRLADSIDKRSTAELKSKLNNLNNNGQGVFGKNAAYEMGQIQTQVRSITAEAERATRSQMGFVESFRQAMVKFPVWVGASTLFFGAIRSGKMFMDIITEIDSKMISLAKVMGDGADLESVFERANSAAIQFGQTIGGVLDTYTEFARQGMNEADTAVFGNAALVAANVGEIDAKQAAEYLTSISAQWETQATDAMRQVDSLNQISNEYATTVEKLAQGQAKAGSTAKSMGLTFDETNAVIGALTAKTKQSGDEIGNFMKAVLPKLYVGVGKSTIEGLGINMKEANGETKSAIALLEEVSQKIKGIDKEQQATIIRGLGGTYHYQRMQVLLDDLSKADSLYKQIKDTSENSAGSAIAENQKYLESVEAKINKAKVAIEQFALALGDAFVKSGMLDGLRLFTTLLTGLTKHIQDFGSTSILFGTVGAAISLFSKNVRSGFDGARESLANFIAKANELRKLEETSKLSKNLTTTHIGVESSDKNKFADNQTGAASQLVRNSAGEYDQAASKAKAASTSTLMFSESQKRLSTSAMMANGALTASNAQITANAIKTKIATVATTAFKTALRGLVAAAGVGILITGLSFALEKIVGHFDKASNASENFKMQQDTLKQSIESMGGTDEINKMITDYDTLHKKIQSGTSLSAEETDKYKNTVSQLKSIFPDLVGKEGQYGATLNANAGVLKQRVALMEKQIELEQKRAEIKKQQEAAEDIRQAKEDLNKSQGAGAFHVSAETGLKAQLAKTNFLQGPGNPSGNDYDNQINKVKNLTEAQKLQEQILKAITQAEAQGNTLAVQGLEKRRQILGQYITEKTNQKALEDSLIQSHATIFGQAIESMKMKNYELGVSGKSVMFGLQTAVQGFATSGKQAESIFNNFTVSLAQDKGFLQKMQTYENALDQFKNAKTEAERADKLPALEAAYGKVAQAILEAARSAGIKNSQLNELKQNLENTIESETGFATSISKSGKVSIDTAKSIKTNTNAVDENSAAKEDNADATDEMKKANEKLANSMKEAASTQELLGKAQGELQAQGSLSFDTLSELAGKYGDSVLSLQDNHQALADFLATKREEEISGHLDMLNEKLANDEEYYKKTFAKGSELTEYLSEQYGIDATQYGTVNELKAGITDIYNNGTAEQQEKLVDGIAKTYGIDLSNFGTLAEKKDALEAELAKHLADKWTSYINYVADTTNSIFEKLDGTLLSKAPGYDIVKSFTKGSIAAAKHFTLDAGKLIWDKDAKFAEAGNQKFNSNIANQLKGIGDKARNAASGLDGVGRSGNGASKGLGKAGKAMKDASKASDNLEKEANAAGISVEKLYKTFTVTTYVADELQMALDKVNFQLEKQKLNTQKYAIWSQKYRDSLKQENKLIDEKTKKLNEQIKSMQEQIKAGQVIEYGLVNSDYNVPYLRFSSNGLSEGQTAKVGAVGSTTQEKVWNYLRGKGLSEHAVAGIMGNIERESRFTPGAQEQGGTGIGLVQWSFGRADNLRNYAKKKGKSWKDLNTQLDFLWHELTTTEVSALAALKSSKSVTGAANAFQQKFERAGVVMQGQRNAAAEKYYKQFKGTTAGGQVVKGMNGKSIVDDPTAYLFDSTFGRYTKGPFRGPHHGLDITSVRINNAKLRAAKSGVVTYSGWTGGGNTVSIFDGKNTYTYMHMIRPSHLKKGDKVAAGQHVGNVGSTYGAGGQSSGPHVHVQVNKGRTPNGTFLNTFSGKNAAIDPRIGNYLKVSGGGSFDFSSVGNLSVPTGELSQEMVDAYNKQQEEMLAEVEAGINEHNEAEKMKQKVDELRKKLMDTQLEAIRNTRAKEENLFNIHKSNIAAFDHSRELQAAKSAKYEYELNKVEFEKGRNTEEWRKKNAQLQTSRELEKGWEQDKVKYIDKVVKQNKDGILGGQTAFRDELEKMKRDAEQNIRDIESGVRQARGEIAASLVDQIIDDYTKDVEKLQGVVDKLGKDKSRLDASNVDEAKKIVEMTTKQSKETQALADKTQFYIKQLEQQAKSITKNAELKKRLTTQIKDMKAAYDDATLAAHEFLREAADVDIERQLTINLRRLKEFQSELRKAEYSSSFINQEFQIDLFRDNQEKIIKGYDKEREALVKNKKELEEKLELYKTLPSQAQKIQESIDEITTALEENAKAMHTVRYDLANNMINSIKTVYQKQLEVATKAYDDEYKEFEKMINKKLKLIDDEASEETFQKDIRDKTEALNKIRDEIANRLGDDSLSNQKKLKDLREQLRIGEEEYEAYLRNKNREEKKQALQEELQDKNEQLNQQKEDLNKAFTDLLEDTRKFNSIQEQLMEGQIDKYKTMVTELTTFVSENMKNIGNSVGQNIIDGIEQTFQNLIDVASILNKSENGDIPVPNSILKPKPLSEATAAAIKQINALAPSAILNGLQIKEVAKPKDIGKSTNVTTNNNTQAKSLVNIENFNGTEKEVNDLATTLENALRKSGTL